MSDHTPGPWIVDEKGHVYALAFYKPAPFTAKDGTYHGDHMAGLVALPYGCPGAGSNQDANGALIAAAPELLAALEAADASAGKAMVEPAGQPARECYAIPVELWETARAAIRKARGAVVKEATR